MDRRKKRTSTNQYMMYIDMMETDSIFATGKVPRDVDVNYMWIKWKELSDKLNTCGSGPTLTAEEWRKRLTDWKNTTRCKYRRSITNDDISLTSLEMKALDLVGKTPNVSNPSEQLSIHLKCEKEEHDEDDEDDEMDQQRTSESFQKELQAAVEEAIGGDEDEEIMDEPEVEECVELVSDPLPTTTTVVPSSVAGVSTRSVGSSNATYRTIMVGNAAAEEYADVVDVEEEHVEYVAPPRRQQSHSLPATTSIQTVVNSSAPAVNVTKLINGELPMKRLRSHGPESIVYEVKKAPPAQQHHPPAPASVMRTRSITIHNNSAQQQVQQHNQQLQQQHTEPLNVCQPPTTTTAAGAALSISTANNATETREIARQLKRLADIKAEKLKFEVARFKFNNPGFAYNINHQL